MRPEAEQEHDSEKAHKPPEKTGSKS